MRWTRHALWLLLASCSSSPESQTSSMEDRTRGPAAAAPMDVAEELEQSTGDFGGGLPEGGDGMIAITRSPRAQRAASGMAIIRGAEMTKGEAPGRPDADQALGGEVVDAADVRRWFPEAFLWQPLVETGDEGAATVEVTVPDQLTTWRVLGLAHDRRGEQAGDVLTFRSALDLYVDPVTPAWLYSGDRVVLPVQVSNTTAGTRTAPLQLSASGALTGAGVAEVEVPAGGTVVERLSLSTRGVGAALVRADLGSIDAAERQVPVRPVGRPVVQQVGGVFSGSRALAIPAVQGADAATQQVEVLVFPGPLSVLSAEEQRLSTAAATPQSAAYGFALASRMAELMDQTGQEADEDELRRLRLGAWQRVVPYTRSPDLGLATDLLLSLRNVDDNPLAERFRDRLVRIVVDGQRGDGSWARQSRAELDQVLVQTAVAAWALPESEERARGRAAGVIERYGDQIDDAYTAAVVLASGLAEGEQRDRLGALVQEGMVSLPDGPTTLRVPAGVLNASGEAPRRPELLAWTALALLELDQPEAAGDLVGELMGGYSGAWGFGAGWADVAALEAVCRVLPGLSEPVTLSLLRDGEVVSTAELDAAQPKVPVTLLAEGEGRLTLQADPAVPGLSFLASRRGWVPWSGSERMPGVDIEIEAPEWKVGVESDLRVSLSAAQGQRVVLEQGLPAGATVDEAALQALIGDELTDVQVQAHRVVLTTRAFSAGEVMELTIPVRPAFAGQFSTGPLRLSDARHPWQEPIAMAPAAWTVAL